MRDLLISLVGGTIAGTAALIVKWLGDRGKRISGIKTLLSDLRVELTQNKDLPRQARTKIRVEALNRSMGEVLLHESLRTALQDVDGCGRVLVSFGEREVPIPTITSVFEQSYVPAVEKALLLIKDEEVKWNTKKWWKVWPRD